MNKVKVLMWVWLYLVGWVNYSATRSCFEYLHPTYLTSHLSEWDTIMWVYRGYMYFEVEMLLMGIPSAILMKKIFDKINKLHKQ